MGALCYPVTAEFIALLAGEALHGGRAWFFLRMKEITISE
jgi:hypothetical protein